MKLYFTPRSHFSRKVRVLLDAWSLDVQLIDAGNVAGTSPEAFGPHPLLKVPTLVDDDSCIIESDHIAQYLARRHDPQDTFGVLTCDLELLNARAVMNGVMAAEVEVILARRTGIDTGAHERFTKIIGSIQAGLDWLEAHADAFPESPTYAGFHLTCLWDHLALYDVVELGHPRLREHVGRMSALPYVAASAPR